MARRTEEFSGIESRIQDRFDRARRSLFAGIPGSPNFSAPYMEPPVDVYLTESDVVVVMEIAGIPEEEIEIEVEGRHMLIRGHRKAVAGPVRRAYFQMEIANGPFQREILLPAEVNPEKLTAVYKDGILQITLPKSEQRRGRQLRIVVR
ncbi:MAG: Hsp20/alpha crystallin family protein [Chloroflexota bacterium]